MNALVRHHSHSIHFGYSCFDRMLCNLHVPALQWHAHVYHFLKTYRQAAPVTPAFLRRISNDYHHWLNQQAGDSHIPIVEPPPQVRREEWVGPYFQELAGRPGVAVILKCRERARVAVSFPKLGNFVNLAWRFVNLYYFY